jgi:hypothetical protein
MQGFRSAYNRSIVSSELPRMSIQQITNSLTDRDHTDHRSWVANRLA